VVFPFINNGGEQIDIIRQGIPVFGTRLGDELERDRMLFKQTLLDVGLPIVPFNGKPNLKEMEFSGFDSLRSILQRTKDKYIKISDLRGHGETRHHIDYEHSEEWLFQMGHQWGSQRHDFKVMIEDCIKSENTVEVGDDRYIVDGKTMPKLLFGVEDKDASYTCKVISPDNVPDLLQNIHKKMAPIFKNYGIRSIVSTEMRVPDKNTAYFTDITMRHPSPPSEITCAIWKNLADLYLGVAKGEDVKPEEKAQWAASVFLYTSRIQNEVTPVNFPDKYRERVKLQNYCIDKTGQYKCIPQDGGDCLGAVVGLGDTMEEAQMNALEIAEEVKAEGMHYAENTFDKMDETIEKATKLGVWVK
jgi:hypothetical protein